VFPEKPQASLSAINPEAIDNPVSPPLSTSETATFDEGSVTNQTTVPPTLRPKELETPLAIIRSGMADSKRVALTFDDGPHPKLTLQVLQILRERNAKATFFVLGDRVRRYPWALRQIMAEGHEIGNHTYSHRWLNAMSNDLIQREIEDTQNQIKLVTGSETTLFRPPYGAFRSNSKPLFKKHNLTVVHDKLSPTMSSLIITNHVKNGSIILCHDIQRATVKALPAILDYLSENGYELDTVSQLCGLTPVKIAQAAATETTRVSSKETHAD
jgi:peptidoglycan/xylan/chitin deacetylase (PgdA/CDA1 family)